MPWSSPLAFQPALPAHCEPTSDFLLRFSSAFHVCVPTPLAFISNLLGTISIISWLFAQLPQIYKNWSISSTSGLSIFFLVEWCLGDITNLLGALFTHQASWQVTIAAYYVFVDLCLVGQWIWYEKMKHGNRLVSIWRRRGSNNDDPSNPYEARPTGPPGTTEETNVLGGQPLMPASRPRIIFRAPTFDRLPSTGQEKSSLGSASPSATSRGTSIYRVGNPSSMPSPSPRTVLLIACLIAIVHASPVSNHPSPAILAHDHLKDPPRTFLETFGLVSSWFSTFLYLGSRIPQLIKNWRRKSTAGLSPHLFMAAFSGNLFYSAALATNPCAWLDFGPYGGGGIVGPEGSDRAQWVAAALPFFLGAAGVLGLDASVGVQFLLYGSNEDEMKIAIVDDLSGRPGHWRRVSGWMRGWIPGKSPTPSLNEESQSLIRDGVGYGAI